MAQRSLSLGKDFTFFRNNEFSKEEVEKVKHIALYLTQFHPTKENDEWWGKNFTEWNNVAKATSQFVDHYQPHVPHDIGFYNLLSKETWLDQIKLAKNYGIYGFCFYFYWFNGRRLLEKPLDLFLNNKDLNMPFCLFWANDSWSRTWHGFADGKKCSQNTLLVEQSHNDEDDEAFIQHLIDNYFNDERYIKINGKPVLIIYHTYLFPDITKTVAKWRKKTREHFSDLYLMYVLMPGQENEPLLEGFDSAMQFPPIGCKQKPLKVKKLNYDFQGTVYSYSEVVRTESQRQFKIPVARGCFPSWDNEARRPTKGISYQDGSPEIFEQYLTSMNQYSLLNPLENESIVFLNAWNEWAEGAHMEPDRNFGYAWLQAVANVIKKNS